MGADDWRSVVEDMRLSRRGYLVDPDHPAADLERQRGDVVELTAPNGKALGRLTVEEIFERDVDKEAELVYRTTDDEHPGVAAIRRRAPAAIAGTIEADALPDHDEAFMRRYLTPEESRKAFADRGWKRIVAFQTRNPIHRAHEYLTKAALEISRRPLPASADRRDQGGRHPRGRADALLRGPDGELLPPGARDARRQPGEDALRRARGRRCCTRSSAATTAAPTSSSAATTPGSATTTAPTTPSASSTTSTSPSWASSRLFFEHTFWCNDCEGMASNKTCPHPQESHLFLSGTKVREMLANGEKPPPEFTREEVAEILIDAYRKESTEWLLSRDSASGSPGSPGPARRRSRTSWSRSCAGAARSSRCSTATSCARTSPRASASRRRTGTPTSAGSRSSPTCCPATKFR